MTSITIVKAAIRDDLGKVWSVEAPGRHHHIIKLMRESGYTGHVGGPRQGFVLSDGRFASREECYPIAKGNGQLKGGKMIGSILTSEDLW